MTTQMIISIVSLYNVCVCFSHNHYIVDIHCSKNSDFMNADEKLVEQIKKVEDAHRKHLESQKQMIEDITKQRDFCDNRDMSLDNYKKFLDELYKLFEMKL